MTEERSSVEDYYVGKAKVFGFLMKQVMKKIRKVGNPELAKKSSGRCAEVGVGDQDSCVVSIFVY